MLKEITVEQEKQFEVQNVLRKETRYLHTNPMDRYSSDEIYRKKITYIENELKDITGLILDIGGNTAGEATILTQKGYHFIVSDINEYALQISKKRISRFNLISPSFFSFDAHAIPFEANTFDSVTVIEALHHFVDYDKVLSEIYRVLKPGGKFISLEPYALNPIRKVSEIRDYFRGTIEKSFTKSKLLKLLRRNSFIYEKVDTVSMGKSSWKLQEIPSYRKPIAYLHSYLSNTVPSLFGTLLITAFKEKKHKEALMSDSQEYILICPITKLKLQYDNNLKLFVNESKTIGYRIFDEIPVLIPSEAKRLQ